MTRKEGVSQFSELGHRKEEDPESDHIVRIVDTDGLIESLLSHLVLDVGKESDRPDDGEESQPAFHRNNRLLTLNGFRSRIMFLP